jgi:glucuronoarabinoxylan endo-1,4-beta-xylanase
VAATQIQAATAAIDVGTKYQTIRGFGASTAWGSTFNSTGDPSLLWSFKDVPGAGLSLHRIRIDPSSGSTSELAIAQKAVSYGVTVWATPWTPPAADKSNNKTVMGNLTNPSAYATYLVNFAKTMKSKGVSLYAVSAQNEPDANVDYESCVYTGATMATWVGKSMGPAFAGTGVKVMAPETQNWYGFANFWPTLKADADFMKYADIVATHEYGGSPKAYPEIQAAGKDFWETEIYDMDGKDADTGITSGLRVAKLIHEALTIANVNAWHYWWVYSTGSGGLFTNGKATKRLWVEGNYARFVRPDYVRVSATASPTSGVTVSAFYGETTEALPLSSASSAEMRVVIVAINTNSSATNQTFSLSGFSADIAKPYVTDTTRSLAQQTTVTVSGNSFTYALPPKSVTSFTVSPIASNVPLQASAPSSLQVVHRADGCWAELPSQAAGRIELLTASGRLLQSHVFPAGANEVLLDLPSGGGLYIARVIQSGSIHTARLLQPSR